MPYYSCLQTETAGGLTQAAPIPTVEGNYIFGIMALSARSAIL